MSSNLIHIQEDRVRELLTWDATWEAVENALTSVTEGRAHQSQRLVLPLPGPGNLLFSMPGYLDDAAFGALGCKMFTVFPSNRQINQPVIKTNFFLLDEHTGILKAVIEAAQLTEWRTAAASAIATKCLHPNNNDVLAILGSGDQGKAHAMAFQHFFNFSQIRLWNRTPQRAQDLAKTLNAAGHDNLFTTYDSVEDCIKGADVIITATGGDATILRHDWLKKNVHINAVRVNPDHRELDDEIYKACEVYVDNRESAENELKGIKALGVEFKGQIGDLIKNLAPLPKAEVTTIFQSLGIAVEDCALARVVYDLHLKKINE